MAQIIKHRRGSVTQLKDVTARIGELVMATGSIGDLNGPFLFLGETEGAAGAYRPTSKIYQGSAAPTISVGSHGSVLDGTPFYASSNESLYVLSKDGNSRLDLTGNIEGNLISGVTINNLTGTTANLSNNGGTALMITGDIVQTGSFYTSGDIVLRGNINIGDNLTGDTVTLNSEISSSLIPDSNNNFDLGSTSKYWRNLYVSGTAYVDTLQANQVNFSDLGILQDLSVSGSTYLGNDGSDVLVVSGAAYFSTLTEHRVVTAGPNGALEDDANFTFNATTLKVGDFEVDVDGDIRTSGSLMVKNGATITGSYRGHESASDWSFQGNNFSETYLNTNGTLIINAEGYGVQIQSNNLEVQGTTRVTSDLYVNGNTDVTGSLTARNTLTVTGTTTIYGDETVNGILTVTGNTQLGGNLYVSGNLEVLGSSTEVHIQSQTIELDDNIIRLNAYSPFERYAGFEVMDSGSSGVSASMVWDSLSDYWMFVSASGQSSKFIGTTFGTYGSEVSLTNTFFPIATGTNTIGDSLLRYSGTTLSFNTNKFTVDSNDGATLIAGNVTLSAAGGADAGTSTSAIMFRNSSNVLGYVSTTTSTVETVGLLGYRQSNGALTFSDLIDGGSY